MLNSFIIMFTTMMAALLIQNVVLCGGYGISEMLRLAMRPKFMLYLGGMVAFFSVMLSSISSLLEKYIGFLRDASIIIRGIEYSAILLTVYLATTAVMQYVLHLPISYIKRTSVAAFNSLVLAVPFLNRQAEYSLSGSLGNALGCALAFVLAAVMVSSALVCVDNDSMPESFRGLPALFVFVGILTLGFMGFAG